MKNFQHFVITRFNLDLYAWDKNRIPTRTEKWLQHRFDIFEQYCLPSMQAQTTHNYIWLCLFDSNTPAEYRQRIDSYRAICPTFTPVYYTAGQARQLTQSLRETLLGYRQQGGGRSPLIT